MSAFLFQQMCQRERGFVHGNRQSSAKTLPEDSSSFVKLFDGFAKFERLVDIQQVVSMFIEASDSFGCQPPAQSEDEIVIRELSFNFTMRDRHFSFERIDVGNFGFDEVHSSI